MTGTPHPVMLIHGFSGSPEHWELDGFTDFLVEGGGFDPDLIHLFHYGYKEEGGRPVYNNQGDITAIAHRLSEYPTDVAEELDSQIDRLSQESLGKGGPEKVDIIAHSMGGIIARYYLSCREADRWGTKYSGKVGKLIQLGSPNLGVPTIQVIEQLIPEDSWIRGLLDWIEKLPFVTSQPTKVLERLEANVRRMQSKAIEEEFGDISVDRSILDSPALDQLVSGSPFMEELNRPGKMPEEVDYHSCYGDISFNLEVKLLGMPIFRRTIPLGDMIVPAESASTIPGVEVQRHPFTEKYDLIISLGRAAPTPPIATRAFADYMPPCYHSNLRRNREIQETVLSILTS
ncbi:MAG: esterase/lipase family protein [Anaerolineae bacterium]